MKLLHLLPLLSLAHSAPSPQTLTPIPPDSTSVHVNNMTTYGTGCPIGGGPIAQATKDGRPIFAFTEWGLSLPDPDSETPGAAEKWCSEEIDLGGGPVGMRMRIESVTVSGVATLGAGTKLAVAVETRLGGVEGGVSSLLPFSGALIEGAFEVALVTEPTDVWSECVPASGVVPHLSIKVTAGLVGTEVGGGMYSTGTLAGESRDLKKALKVRFTPVWQPCSSTGVLVPS
ncbi:hypothetical protein B0T18DRAFT_326443 [Schizothecium vesticola]|uniref:Uncharacterized protein n=1 Tax=Schizothecium vesticola TaxID=314040 RepID=A0AA40K5T9_9PEZI|nr:hypothetical protein B0T18DRAFT_326443 [Schizothecium vesticola]